MGIQIELPSYLQSYASGREVAEVRGSTVGESLNQLVKQFPGLQKMLFTNDGQLHSYVGIYVNGKDAYPDELASPLKDGDKIYLLYIIGGG